MAAHAEIACPSTRAAATVAIEEPPTLEPVAPPDRDEDDCEDDDEDDDEYDEFDDDDEEELSDDPMALARARYYAWRESVAYRRWKRSFEVKK